VSNVVKIEYEFTVDDMVDVMRRAVKRKRLWLTWRWRRRAIESMLLGSVLYLIIEGAATNRMAGAALFAVLSYFATWFIRGQSLSASYSRLFREHAGGDGPFVFELEITSEALISKQLGETHRREWTSVTKITEAKGGIEFDTRSGLVFARDSGFKSSAERSEFLDLARQFFRESQIKASWPKQVAFKK
jgi:hypothetical protein